MPDSAKILILNGPNLNLLGSREPDIYGHETLADIEKECVAHAKKLKVAIDFRQSNNEGECVDWIQEAVAGWSGIIINPAAYTHTSIAIMDALKLVGCPIIEIHLSNIFARESFRHHSYVSPVATGIVCGFGGNGYILALEAMARLMKNKKEG
ncbi:MAG: type II 3-dehydroquinate dehydratase [Rhodospirillaceae bacterium]|nr:type II 3-dehydroquinate dehydratase [Rhodospirillaceae bacterium]